MPVSPATITSQGGSSSRQDMKRFLLTERHERKQWSSELTAAASTTFKRGERRSWGQALGSAQPQATGTTGSDDSSSSPSIPPHSKYSDGFVPVPVQRHQCNLETAPGDGVEVNRPVGLTQLCDEQTAGRTHVFGILLLALLAVKIRSGETPYAGFTYV